MRSTVSGLALSLLLAVLAGCGGSSSPTAVTDPGVVIVESDTLVPVSDACHVQGTVHNTTDGSTFKVVLRWQALDAADKVLGTTRVDIEKLLPGERRPYDATGFSSNSQGLVPCSKISRFERVETTITPG